MIRVRREILDSVEFRHTAELSVQIEYAPVVGALQSLGFGGFSADEHPSMRADIGDTVYFSIDLCEQHRFPQRVVDGLRR